MPRWLAGFVRTCDPHEVAWVDCTVRHDVSVAGPRSAIVAVDIGSMSRRRSRPHRSPLLGRGRRDNPPRSSRSRPERTNSASARRVGLPCHVRSVRRPTTRLSSGRRSLEPFRSSSGACVLIGELAAACKHGHRSRTHATSKSSGFLQRRAYVRCAHTRVPSCRADAVGDLDGRRITSAQSLSPALGVEVAHTRAWASEFHAGEHRERPEDGFAALHRGVEAKINDDDLPAAACRVLTECDGLRATAKPIDLRDWRMRTGTTSAAVAAGRERTGF